MGRSTGERQRVWVIIDCGDAVATAAVVAAAAAAAAVAHTLPPSSTPPDLATLRPSRIIIVAQRGGQDLTSEAGLASAAALAHLRAAAAQAAGAAARHRVSLVTRGLYGVLATDTGGEAGAGAAAGLAKALFWEARAAAGAAVDLPTDAQPSPSTLAAALTSDEYVVALRGTGHTFGLRLVPTAQPALSRAPPSLRGRTAIVLGGSGGLGAHRARQHAAAGAACIVLASRSGGVGGGGDAAQLAARHGGAVISVALDTSDAVAVARLLAWARDHLPPVASIDVAAGVSGFDLVAETSPSTLARVAAPKLGAAAALAAAAPATAAVTFFSSTSAAWAQAGAGHYSAANAGVDGVAATARGAGRAFAAPRLGPFADIGMAASHTDQLTALGIRPMPASALASALAAGARGAGNAVVAALEPGRFAAVSTARGGWRLLDEWDVEEVGGEVETAAAAATPPAPPSSLPSLASIRSAVLTALTSVLGPSTPLDDGDGAFPAGALDSLAAVEAAAAVSSAVGLTPPLPPTVAYDYPSVAALAAHVHGVLAAKAGVVERVVAAPTAPLPLTTTSRPTISLRTVARLAAPLDAPDVPSIVPHARWDTDAPPRVGRRARAGPPRRFATWLPCVDAFDAAACGVPAPEADLMDPQQRLLLEGAAAVLAGGGGDSAAAATTLSLRSRAGVWVGIQQMEYGGLAAPHLDAVGPYSATGGPFSVAAGRVAFVFGLTGPAVAVDTACSSALVAIHLAARHLRAEGEVGGGALAAGVNLLLASATTAAATAAGMLTPDGRCKALDAAADGYGRAEACVVTWLESEGEGGGGRARPPRALLAGSAVNQDGRSSSLTAPNGPAQQAVLRAAAADAGGARLAHAELHGTGTALGDPIELGAVWAAAAAVTDATGQGQTLLPLAVAAAKSRLGHSEPVAGAVGVVAAAAAVTASTLLPNPCLRTLGPHVLAVLDGPVGARRPLAAPRTGARRPARPASARLPSKAPTRTPC